MINLPETTKIGKRIPKEGFYNNAQLKQSEKRLFVDEIDQIIWQNLLSATTLNVDKGEKVNQIDIVRINLKKQDFNKSILEIIEKIIPRHLIFLMVYNDSYQICVNYKEESQKGKFKIIESYATGWMSEGDINISIKGLNLDQVYENLVFQIAGNKVEKKLGSDLKESVLKSQETERIKKKIAELSNKLHSEKQFNIQLKISNEIRMLENQLLE